MLIPLSLEGSDEKIILVPEVHKLLNKMYDILGSAVSKQVW